MNAQLRAQRRHLIVLPLVIALSMLGCNFIGPADPDSLISFTPDGPQDASVMNGDTVTLTTRVAVGVNPEFQWYVNSTVRRKDIGVTFEVIPGATSLTYTFVATYANNGDNYYNTLTTAIGTTFSREAKLTVTPKPVAILTQPVQSVAVVVGGSVTLSIEAAGTKPIAYQWFKNAQPIAGATDASFTLANVQASENGAQYTVSATNLVGAVLSHAAILFVANG